MDESVDSIAEHLRVRGREWARLPTRERRRLVEVAFSYWRDRGFPYFEMSRKQIAREFRNLMSKEPADACQNGAVVGSVVGLRLANLHQRHMWSVRVSRYKCPMDVFTDDKLLRAALERAWKIWPNRFGANPSSLRRMLKTFPGTASVSNFRPTLARAIISRFSPPGGTVVDFAAGFGGRLVGCLTLARDYIGIEPCREQVKGLRATVRELRRWKPDSASARILAGCAEEALPEIARSSADLVFSSPPYYDWERYSEHPSQSYLRYRTYDEWLHGFLGEAIRESERILRPGARLVLNVSRHRRSPTPEDVEHLARRVGLRRVAMFCMLLARVPYLHPRDGGAFKSELLLVFEKRR